MATLCTHKVLEKIDQPVIHYKFTALGLKEHCPRALLHGPIELGGICLPTKNSKMASQRINYFFYHVRQKTTVGEQLVTMLPFLHMEVQVFQNVLEVSFYHYGHLGTTSLIKTIWGETEPHSLFLRPYHAITTPSPQGQNNVELMKIAANINNYKQIPIILTSYRPI